MKIRWPVILGILFALTIGCSTEARGPRRYLENGVEVVDNGSRIYEVEGRPRALSLEEVLRIDLEDPQYAELGLSAVRDAGTWSPTSSGRAPAPVHRARP